MLKYVFLLATFLWMGLQTTLDAQDYQRLEEEFDKFFSDYVSGGLVDYDLVNKQKSTKTLVKKLEAIEIPTERDVRKAFLINVYNLLVIHTISTSYPISSVHDIPNFFDKRRYSLGGKKYSLDQIEKDLLYKEFDDPRLHFALICGAKSCPPILNQAFKASDLNLKLDIQAKLAINDPILVDIDWQEKTVLLSEIFSWYSDDFTNDTLTLRQYLNKYLIEPIPDDFTEKKLRYDWAINDIKSFEIGKNKSRYIVSSTIPKSGIELKLFNNLYHQKTPQSPGSSENSSGTYYTGSIGFLYGLSNVFNLGFDIRYRRVRTQFDAGTALEVFQSSEDEGEFFRSRVATVGPKIRWAPLPEKYPNLSIQSALWIPTGNDFQENPFLDWDHMTWATQIFNDKSIGNDFSLFTELSFFLEDIGKDQSNRFSTPLTAIVSYFPSHKSTMYGLAQYARYWESPIDYFYQFGLGAKYQITPNFEVELLYNYFDNKFLRQNDGSAATYNIGFRYSR